MLASIIVSLPRRCASASRVTGNAPAMPSQRESISA